MTDEPPCVSYADRARSVRVLIQQNVRIARDTYRVRLQCPEIARLVLPGQFLMLRLPESDDPLLGRPFALYDVVPGPGGVPQGLDVVYLTVGKMTHRLAACGPGQPLDVWGPLGNGFTPGNREHLVMVAGGIGQTPFFALAQEFLGLRSYGQTARQGPTGAKATLCYGVRGEAYFAGVGDFQRVGVDVRLSTDDGSSGHHGMVTDLVRPVVHESPHTAWIVCCGPEPMLAATARIAKQLGVPCQVSLETPMACGLGICFSCVAKVRDVRGHWDYRRTCVEGPVFNADEIEF